MRAGLGVCCRRWVHVATSFQENYSTYSVIVNTQQELCKYFIQLCKYFIQLCKYFIQLFYLIMQIFYSVLAEIVILNIGIFGIHNVSFYYFPSKRLMIFM